MAFYSAPTRAWELGLGALLALRNESAAMRSRSLREGLAFAGLAAILVAVFCFDDATPFPGAAALLPCLGAAALIMAGGGGPSIASSILGARPVVFVGLISYSLYLWHWPILAFLRLRYSTVDLPLQTTLPALLVAAVLATLSWRYVEQPFRDRRRVGRAPIFALAGTSVAATCVAAFTILAGDGLPRQFSNSVQLAVADDFVNPRLAACFERFSKNSLCEIGEEGGGGPDFLLSGDSHARAMMPAIDAAAKLAGHKGLAATRAACAPLLGVVRSGGADCARFNESVVAELRERPDIATVVLHARWSDWEKQVRSASRTGTAAMAAGSGDAADDRASFRQALLATIGTIRDSEGRWSSSKAFRRSAGACRVYSSITCDGVIRSPNCLTLEKSQGRTRCRDQYSTKRWRAMRLSLSRWLA